MDINCVCVQVERSALIFVLCCMVPHIVITALYVEELFAQFVCMLELIY